MRAFAPFIGLAAFAAAAILPAGLVSAGEADQPSAGSNARPILICATDSATRRAFTREHGAAPVFITAREALSVRTSDPAWSAPRCMTAREHARFREASISYAAVR